MDRQQLFDQILQEHMEPGEAIRALRKHFKISREKLANKIGISRRLIAELEQGKGNPTLDSLNKLFRPFGLRMTLGKMTSMETQRPKG